MTGQKHKPGVSERRYLRSCFYLGLPSLLSATVAVVIVVISWDVSDFDRIAWYKSAVNSAVAADDLVAADTFLRQLVYLDPEDPWVHYQRAIIAKQQGNLQRAYTQMARIAPLERPGYAPAHFWVARELLTSQKEVSGHALKVAQQHLTSTIQLQPDHADAHGLLGQIYFRLKQYDLAAEHLAVAVERRPSDRLLLAKLLAIQGRTENAEREARQASEFFQKKLSADTNDLVARLAWADAQAVLGNYEQAETIVLEGLSINESDGYRDAIARFYVGWVMHLRQDPQSFSQRLALLQRALSHVPDSQILLNHVARLATEQTSEEMRDEIEQTLAEGKASALANLILGTHALRQGDSSQALLHLEQAFELNARMPEILNNLAWALAHAEPPRLERALELADAALTASPAHAEFRDTRGHVLLKLKRYKAALTDLQIALQAFPQRAELHQALAESYESLGEDRMAERHRELWQELVSQSKQK